MAKIIGIIQVKGGAGRSTLATNLAGLMAGAKKTALLDCDMPQGTSASWYAIRQEEKPSDRLTIATAANHIELVEETERLAEEHDLVVIDAPPRIAEITRATLILSNLCLIPLGASASEIWATSDLLKTIEEAKQRKGDVDARIIWNRFRANTKSAQELSEAVREELGLKELKSKLGYRVAYSEAIARGLTVMEWPDKAAREEFKELGREIERLLRIKFVN